jgi:hypothetical protein
MGTFAGLVESNSVDLGRVAAVADLVRSRYGEEAPEPAAWDDPRFWNVEAPRADRCQFLAVGNAINFRFWTLADGQVVPAEGDVEGDRLRGSMYMWRRLRLAVSRGEFSLDAAALAEVDEDVLREAFADDHGAFPLGPGAGDRAANLRDLGTQLRARWSGRFERVIAAAGGSLDQFARLSAEFRAFDDPVRKLTMVNAIMLAGSGLAAFDREPLPGVDYHLVKQAVRQGLVNPAPPVARKLVDGALLDAGESLSLRAATLEALLAVASRAGVSTAVVDNLYWLNGRVCAEGEPACVAGRACSFEAACAQRVEYGMPLEMTRYY